MPYPRQIYVGSLNRRERSWGRHRRRPVPARALALGMSLAAALAAVLSHLG